MVMLPQLEMFTGTGAMKSLISEVNEVEDRVFTNADPNASHVPGGNTPAAFRLIAASPKACAGRLTAGLASVSDTVAALVAPSDAPVNACSAPHTLPVHIRSVSVGVFEPPWKP